MNSQLKFFGISTSLFDLAYAIGRLFSVLYIYIFFGNSLVLAIGGLAFVSLVHLVTVLIFGKLMGKIGVRTTLIISTVIFFLSFIPLYTIDDSNAYLNYGISLLLFGIARGLYYLPYHFFVLKLTEENSRGAQYGKFLAICAFFSIFAPFIGGYVTNNFGIQGIAVFSGIVFALSIIPLSKIENLKFNVTIDLIKLLRLPNIKKTLNMNIFINLQNQTYFWEIFVFLLLNKDYIEFGLLFVIINIIGFIAAPILGRFLDHKDKKKIFKIDGIFTGFIWIIRFFAYNPLTVVISDSLYKINNSVKDTNFNLLNYDLLTRDDDNLSIDEKIILREVYLNLLIVISIPIFLLLVGIFDIRIVFLIAAIFSFLFTLI